MSIMTNASTLGWKSTDRPGLLSKGLTGLSLWLSRVGVALAAARKEQVERLLEKGIRNPE
jgi:hypothetical protein